MGKEATAATAAMKRKKKGRPPKNQIPPSVPRNPISLDSPPITYTRSHRRNPKFFKSPSPEIDDDDREEKKVKLVVRLPQSDLNPKTDQKQPHNKTMKKTPSGASESASDSEPDSRSASEPDSEDHDARVKKRKINAVDGGSDGAVSVQEKKAAKAMDSQQQQHGSPLESGPTTTLPAKKLLVFILDRLQKKDTHGVFSEPVDIDELPDYFDVIKQPMDFGTVRKKLDSGAYKKLEELEADVFLICSNAMLYNAEDTIYYRQARSIQDIAKRDFENLRHADDNGEPKIVRRGRPPNSKNQKKSIETSPLDRVDPSSGATPSSAEDKGTASNSYNLRKGPALYRYRSNDLYVSPYRQRNGENYSDSMGDWNDEFPASILRADMKYGKKQFTVDENKRNTYRQQFHPQFSADSSSALSNSMMGDSRRLVLVGLHEPLAYARSLARYAANLGSVAWEVASKKIDYVLPPGTHYGPGWIVETGSTSQPSSFSTERQQQPSNSPAADSKTPEFSSPPHGLSEEIVEAVRKLNSQNEIPSQGDISAWKTPFPPIQQKHVYQPQFQRNGFGGMIGYDASTVVTSRQTELPGQNMNPMSRTDLLSNFSLAINNKMQEEGRVVDMWTLGNSSWPAVPVQQSRSLAVQPDLNTSGSAQQQQQQQPDLALQL